MTLFSAIQMGRQSLAATEIALRVSGNNIANADTPGYIREEAVLSPGPDFPHQSLRLGSGVRVGAIVQKVDALLEDRLRQAITDLAAGEARDGVYRELEVLIGELSDTDLSTSLTRFFSALHTATNQPENAALRQMAVLEGVRMTDAFRALNDQVQTRRAQINDEVVETTNRINELLGTVYELNSQIVRAEQAGAVASDAGALRSRRYEALRQLAELLPIRVSEQTSGSVNVFYGGELLIYEGTLHPLQVTFAEDERGLQVAEVQVEATGVAVRPESGKLAGLLSARDEILKGFLDDLDQFVGRMILEFNRLHTSGQGLKGYTSVTSAQAVSNASAPLDAAGLPFTPETGYFTVLVRNTQTGAVTPHQIEVRLHGLPDDTTLEDLAAQLDAIDGIDASVALGKISISTPQPDLEFAFAEDTSGILASLGINHFFEGSKASDFGVAGALQEDAQLLAISASGIGADAANGEKLATLFESPGPDGAPSLQDAYTTIVHDLSQAAFVSRAVTEGLRTYQQTLDADRLAVSGVNLDEEAVRIITLQRIYQANARFITTVSELLETLVRI